MERLSELKNLGPVGERRLLDIGISTRKDIEEFGPANIYRLLRERGYNVSIVMAYALQGAIMDLHWNELPEEIRQQLKIDCKIG